jgi:hypothetical protein
MSEKPLLHVVDFRETEGTCQLCGAEGEELRPYGPKGECICYDCGMLNEEETKKQFGKMFTKDTIVIIEV